MVMIRTISTLTISLFLLLIPNVVSAAPVVSIDTFPPSAIAGVEFDVVFSASGLEPSTNYNSKALGGESFNQVDTWNSSWLQQNASWSSMPEFSSNPEGTASASVKARFESSTSSGAKEFKIRIRKLNTDPYYDSSAVNISVTAVTPSPTAVPATSVPTASPAPTVTPTKTPTPIPTKTPTSKPTTPPNPEPEILGEEITLEPETSKPSSTPEGLPKKNFPILPITLVASGIGMIGFAVYNLVRAGKNTVQN